VGRIDEIVLKAENAGLKKENEMIKAAYDERVEDIQWLTEDVERAVELFKDILDVENWFEWDALKLTDRVKNFVEGQEIIN